MGYRIVVVSQEQMSAWFRRVEGGQWTNLPPDVVVADVRRDWGTGRFEVKVWSGEFAEVGEGLEYERVKLEVTREPARVGMEEKVDEVLKVLREMKPWPWWDPTAPIPGVGWPRTAPHYPRIMDGPVSQT